MRAAVTGGGTKLGRSGTVAAAVLATLLFFRVAPAYAQAVTPASCIAANEEAGPLRHAGKLREARAKLRLCSAQSCPVIVRKDCVAAAAQADADVPTVAFSVQDPAGNDLSAVSVMLDGQPLAEKLDGKALDVDPGEHLFRFDAAGLPPVEKRLVIVEGEKNRRERVHLGPPRPGPTVLAAPLPAPPPAPRANGRRTLGLVLGGTGLGLLAVGGASGLVAFLEWDAAKTACGPSFPAKCANPSIGSSDRSATLVASTVADVTLGVGAAALVTGAVLVLMAPESGSRAATLTLAPGRSGLVLAGTF